MQTTTALLLGLAMAVTASPIPMDPPAGGLLNISPTLSPKLDLGGDNQCTGIGISVCDPITVDREQYNEKRNNYKPSEGKNSGTDNEGVSLINLAPEISPELPASGDNGCLGVGISACNPINVKGSRNTKAGE